MKNILSTIVISIIVSFITLQAITYLDLPFGRSYSGQVVKDSSTKIVQERIEEFKKINNIESDVTKAINNGAPSVVSIISSKDVVSYINDPFGFITTPTVLTKSKTQKIKTGGGSGIIISKDGYILTNKHVIDDAQSEYSVITNNGDTLTVKNIRRDPVLDIAVLQVVNEKGEFPTDLQPATFVSYKSPINIGQFTIAIGNALSEYANTATFGIISAKNRVLDIQGDESYIGLYQTDAPINEGNSGGPLLNTAGEVIGMNTALSQGVGIGFALPLSSEFIQTTLTSLNTGGSINRPYIGLESKLLTTAVAKNLGMKKFEGVYIKSIVKNSPASIGGLLSGDVITEINNTTVQSDMPLLYTLYTFKSTDKISVLVYRDKDYKKLDIALADFGDVVK